MDINPVTFGGWRCRVTASSATTKAARFGKRKAHRRGWSRQLGGLGFAYDSHQPTHEFPPSSELLVALSFVAHRQTNEDNEGASSSSGVNEWETEEASEETRRIHVKFHFFFLSCCVKKWKNNRGEGISTHTHRPALSLLSLIPFSTARMYWWDLKFSGIFVLLAAFIFFRSKHKLVAR
jgi:hypothetical protein